MGMYYLKEDKTMNGRYEHVKQISLGGNKSKTGDVAGDCAQSTAQGSFRGEEKGDSKASGAFAGANGSSGNLDGSQDKKGKIISIVVLIVMLLTIWYMLDVVLLTFILTFIFHSLMEKLDKIFKNFFFLHLPGIILLLLSYTVGITFLVLILAKGVPQIIGQITDFGNMLMNFDVNVVYSALNPMLASALAYVDWQSYLSLAGSFIATYATKLGALSVNFFIALILSFVIIAEKGKIKRFGENLGQSKAAFVYKYFMEYGKIFVNTFAMVMKVQVIIATVNAVLSMIMLKIIGFETVLGLGLMIFILGLVPVAGVIISLFPLCIIAFTLGGLKMVAEVILMILLLHALEAYVLNPKLMATHTKLPVCLVFIVLLVGQHYLGVWGLLVGVPIFIFLMIALNVDYQVDGDSEEKQERKRRRQARKRRRVSAAALEKDGKVLEVSAETAEARGEDEAGETAEKTGAGEKGC